MQRHWLRQRFRTHLGHRGSVLLLIGILWILQGWFVYLSPLPENRPPALHEYLPPFLRELGWLATAAAAIVSAFMRKPGADKWGYGALLVMPVERALSWAGSILMYYTGWLFVPDLRTSVSGLITWATISVLIWQILRWREVTIITMQADR